MKRSTRPPPRSSDFVQQEPDEFQPATEKTEAWIFFDDDNVYVSAKNYETHPERRAPMRCAATPASCARTTPSG